MVSRRVSNAVLPPYDPASDAPPAEQVARYATRIAQRALVLAALLGVVAAACTEMGFRWMTPGVRVDSVRAEAKIHDQEIWRALNSVHDTVVADGRRLDELTATVNSSLYVGCATLRAVQPRSVPQQACAEAASRQP